MVAKQNTGNSCKLSFFQGSNAFEVCNELTEYELNQKRLASIPDIGRIYTLYFMFRTKYIWF